MPIDLLQRKPIDLLQPKDLLAGNTPGAMGTWGDPSVVDVIKTSLKHAPYSAAQGVGGLGRMAGEAIGSEKIADWGKDVYQGAGIEMQKDMPEIRGNVKRALYGGVQSLAQNLPGMAASVATGSPIPALASISALAGGQSYGESREKGVAPGRAAVGAVGEGMLEGVTEYVPLGYLLKPGLSLARRTLFSTLSELVGENINTVGQKAIKWWTQNPDKTTGEFVKEMYPDARQTSLQVLMTSPVMALGAQAAHKIMPEQPKINIPKEIPDEIIPFKEQPSKETPRYTIEPKDLLQPEGIPAAPAQIQPTEVIGKPSPETLYFTYNKAKKILSVNPKQLTDEQLQKHIIKLRDYEGYINNATPVNTKRLIDGDYFTSAQTASSSGVTPKDVWMGQNLKTSLGEALVEKNNRIQKTSPEVSAKEELETLENIFSQIKKITGDSGIKIDRSLKDHNIQGKQLIVLQRKSPGLFTRKPNAMSLDEVADGLKTVYPNITTDELIDKMLNALSKKEQAEKVSKQITIQEFEKTKALQEQPKVIVGDLGLKVGDKFKIFGEQYTVKEKDAEGNFLIEDGDKYIVDEFDKIPQPDEGSIIKGKVKYSQPKLLEGEKTDIKPQIEVDIQGQQKLFGKPSPQADVGGYSATREQAKQYADTERQPSELPEVVELYNDISKGKYPAIERFLKNKLGYYSPRKDKIGLRQDLPVGERLNLTQHLPGFKEVLSTVPDLSLRKNDIAIEADTISVSPRVFKTVSSEFENYIRENSGLAEDEIAFKKDFNKKSRMYELRAYKKDKTLALKVMSHEVFHYIDYLPDKAKRGNVLGHIATLKKYLKHMLDTFPVSTGTNINERKIELRKQALSEAKGQPEFWKAANQGYKKLLAQELSEREVITKQEIMAELKALTQKVKPFDDKGDAKFTAYRYSPKEIYADAGGVLLWNPGLLKQTAPKFYKSFFAYLEKKPEAKQAYDVIQERNGLGKEAVIENRIQRMEEGYDRGNKARQAMETRQRTIAETIMDTIMTQMVDEEWTEIKRIRKLEKKGGSVREIGLKARLSIEELSMIDSKMENLINHFTKEVDIPMRESNITISELGVFAQASRVKEERGKLDIFNPGGETLESSQEMLLHLQNKWGVDKFNKVKELFTRYWELRKRFVFPALDEGKRYDPELVEYVKNNMFYTRFSVNKYLEERYGGQITGTIYKQYGTLSEIENPIVATMIQDMMLVRAAKINESKLDTIEVLRQTNELTPADIDKSTTRWGPKQPKDRKNMAVFTVMRDGRTEHYYVDRQVAESYQYEPYKAKQIAKIVQIVSQPFRRFLVTWNPIWMGRNIFRDIKGTIKNVPEIKLRNIPEFLGDYGRGFKESAQDVFMGKRSDDITKLMENAGIISGRYYAGQEENFETKIEQLQSEFEISGREDKQFSGAWNKLKYVVKKIEETLDKMGRVSEISTKVAGYKYLKKHSAKPERQIMHDVRTLVGTPNARRAGRLQWLTNNIFMFSNINKEGLRSAWESFTTKPSAYIWKTTALNLVPLLTLLGAGAAGVEWVKKVLSGISQYDIENKTIIPTPYTVKGKPVAIGIPEDYQGQIARKLVFRLLKMDFKGLINSATELSPYQFHPLIKIGQDLYQYFIRGENPKDEFRNMDIIPRDKFNVGGMPAAESVLKHSWNEAGGRLFYNFGYDEIKEDHKSIESLKGVFPMNILGTYLIISDQGIKQSSYKIQDEIEKKHAKLNYEVKQSTTDYINKNPQRKRDGEIYRELYIPLVYNKKIDPKVTSPREFLRSYRRTESGKEDSPYIDSLRYSKRNESKEALLDKYSKSMSRQEFAELLKDSLRANLITEKFVKDYLKKITNSN